MRINCVLEALISPLVLAELATGANVLGSVGLVEGHIKPFHLKI